MPPAEFDRSCRSPHMPCLAPVLLPNYFPVTGLHSFPRAAVTKYPRLGSLEQ